MRLFLEKEYNYEFLLEKFNYSEKIRDLYEVVIKNSKLPEIDVLTIFDIINISKEKDDYDFHIVLILLFMVIIDGSMALNFDSDFLSNSYVKEKMINIEKEYISSIEKFIKKLGSGKYNKVITSDIYNYFPLIFNENILYFQKYFLGKSRLELQLKDILSRTQSIKIPGPEIIDEINRKIQKDKESFYLNAKQKIAVFMGVLNNFLII